MKAEAPQFPVELDLGHAWYEWTGLPFVFAVWAGRESARCPANTLDDICQILGAARDRGLQNIRRIAEKNHARYGLTADECRDYLGKHLHFTLGTGEKMGLEMFYRQASRLSLIPEPERLNFRTAHAI